MPASLSCPGAGAGPRRAGAACGTAYAIQATYDRDRHSQRGKRLMASSTSAETSTNGETSANGDSTAEERQPDSRGYHVDIFLVSFAALLLEISYTRVVSFKLFYYYTYLVIGLALLGIGCGAVLTSISQRLRRARTDTILMVGCLAGAVGVIVGYLIVARISASSLVIWDYGTRDSVVNFA